MARKNLTGVEHCRKTFRPSLLGVHLFCDFMQKYQKPMLSQNNSIMSQTQFYIDRRRLSRKKVRDQRKNFDISEINQYTHSSCAVHVA